ncbi:MAG: glycosyl transferase family 2 [Proteobacteria bacterium SG_bin5]|nr:glycosyltransferase family 2 protein [Sphingomonas sp.]OQW45322.1 MAG: glycosyl transferase family 2 [Proteobacteria bacterium SG_bin5]
MSPAVSVIIAAYNGAALIGATIESLKAQSLADFEAVIVDDRSTDSTRDVLRAIDDPRFRVIEAETNQGPVYTRNLALAHARGRYIAALDQDDLCAPDRLAAQLAYLEANPRVVLVAAAADVLEDGALSPSPLPAVTTPALVEWMLCVCNPLVWSSVMIRGDVARRLDPFTRPEILYAEDFDLYHRLSAHGRIARLDTPLLHYRRHAGGASQRYTDTMQASATRVLAERHAALLGQAAAAGAGLLVRHVMLGAPVPDRATLARLGDLLATLQAAFLAQAAPSAEDRALIRWQTARLWAQIGRSGLRAGRLRLADVLAVRPDHLGLGYAGLDALVHARLVGAARRWVGR